MDWKECNYKRFVKETSIDHPLISSLMVASKKKLDSASRLELDETTSVTKIGILYDSLRGVLEALALMKGFKVYNHECFSAFLNEICKEKSLSMDFDRFRKLRNQITYYGKDLPPQEAKIIIAQIIALRETILSKYFTK